MTEDSTDHLGSKSAPGKSGMVHYFCSGAGIGNLIAVGLLVAMVGAMTQGALTTSISQAFAQVVSTLEQFNDSEKQPSLSRPSSD